jgi:hypothetical protein
MLTDPSKIMSEVVMNCSSVIPGLPRKKRLVIFVPGLKENVVPIVKKRTIKKRTKKKRITKGENKAKNDAKGKGRVHISSCTSTWAARLFRVVLLFLAAAEPSTGLQVTEGGETQVEQCQRQQCFYERQEMRQEMQQQCFYERQEMRQEMQQEMEQCNKEAHDQLCKAAPQHVSCTGIESIGGVSTLHQTADTRADLERLK